MQHGFIRHTRLDNLVYDVAFPLILKSALGKMLRLLLRRKPKSEPGLKLRYIAFQLLSMLNSKIQKIMKKLRP